MLDVHMGGSLSRHEFVVPRLNSDIYKIIFVCQWIPRLEENENQETPPTNNGKSHHKGQHCLLSVASPPILAAQSVNTALKSAFPNAPRRPSISPPFKSPRDVRPDINALEGVPIRTPGQGAVKGACQCAEEEKRTDRR
ncbi:hypothetical protein FXF51_04480 [Nonomuraea sp. PA05]|uniref:hypothetical protein n=1 Tax=Nonomuraea sp. PA05 TaxID=2604466 RepID=UPI0011DACC20|nr:hypothetical protein [Nonomuraea sp. PA05]TYB70313.1 hypothetical protein FXF51_04480 [Nonomuraea sp. PA05]